MNDYYQNFTSNLPNKATKKNSLSPFIATAIMKQRQDENFFKVNRSSRDVFIMLDIDYFLSFNFRQGDSFMK
ncbi:hypothetical protein [Metabacillus litoralis]|jgi:hypothetical protein|uniref:hypothetical protein n=1 Tax=Metabacillus litoralis TaxID=152268 RepID=UPI002040A396|nr:hypothetical protein [Metabacillus litoralis]